MGSVTPFVFAPRLRLTHIVVYRGAGKWLREVDFMPYDRWFTAAYGPERRRRSQDLICNASCKDSAP